MLKARACNKREVLLLTAGFTLPFFAGNFIKGVSVLATAVNGKRKRSKFEPQLPYHLMLIPAVIFAAIFFYGPMFGLVMSFQEFDPIRGFFGSDFVGFENFEYIFAMPDFFRVLRNTLFISIGKLLLGIVIPLIMALFINEVRSRWFPKVVQTSVFMPYFLSWVVLAGIVGEVFLFSGPINGVIKALGGEPILFMANNKWFPWILIFTDVWKGMGYNMVVYLAAITGVDPGMYEAADIDGAGLFVKMTRITIPAIMPMVLLLATLSLGSILSAGFDQVFLMYSPVVYESGDIIDTLVYRMGLENMQYSPAAAIGLFKSVISFILVAISYWVAYKVADYKIF